MLQADEIAIAAVCVNVYEILGAEDETPPRSVMRLDIHWRARSEPRASSTREGQYYVLRVTLSGDRGRPVDIDSAGHSCEQVLAVFGALIRAGMEVER